MTMTTSGEYNTSKATKLQPEEVPGVVIDLQYFDAAIELQYPDAKERAKAYAKEPWKYYSNPVHGYLSTRKVMLDEFEKEMEEAGSEKWDRIKQEMGRIAALRKRFEENELKKSLMKELDRCRQNLRGCLQGSTSGRGEPVHKRLIKPNKRRDTKPAAPQQLKGETLPEQGVDHRQGIKREGLDGFKAAVMYFTKEESSNSWKGFTHSHYKAQYPNQKLAMRDILTDNKDNPLSQTHNQEELRYFHFPANNMEWIEVGFFSTSR